MGNSCGNCASNNVEAVNEFVFSKDVPEKEAKKRKFCDVISCVAKIQSVWRGYCSRKHLKSLKPFTYFVQEEYNEVSTGNFSLKE